MSEGGRTGRWPAMLLAGVAIGLVETISAAAFASLVFGGRIDYFTAEGIALYLGGAVLTLAFFAWRAGGRGVIGGLQWTTVALLTIVAATTGLRARGSVREGFLAVVAATVVVTVLCGSVFLLLGFRRRADLIRYVPVPVVGGLIAGAGWVLLQGGLHMAIDEPLFYTPLAEFLEGRAVRLWLPTLVFGVFLLLAARIVRKPLVVPTAIVVGLAAFAIVAFAMGASLDDVRRGGYLLGPFRGELTWKTWSFLALTEADWLAVVRSWAAIVGAGLVAALVLLHHLSGSETALDRDLDTDRGFRDAGLSNLLSGILGGIPGFQDPGYTTLAARMNVDPRRAALVAAAVPLIALLSGATVVGMIPRMIVGGLLVSFGASAIVGWVWDRRRSLSRIEYVVVWAILAVVVTRGYLPGIVVGLALAVVMFAVSYGQTDMVREVSFGDVYRSSVDRPPAQRDRLRSLAARVQILRVSGHVFFGSANRLLDRIRARTEEEPPPRFLVIDLLRVTGIDSSAVAALRKAERLTSVRATEIVFTGASEKIRARLTRGGVLGSDGRVSFAVGLDTGLERCEDALLETASAVADDRGRDGMPSGLDRHLERVRLDEGAVLLRQGELPGDIYVLSEGRLIVETTTPEGRHVRLRTLLPGAVIGEVAMYTGVPRTADVVTETPCVVLRCPSDRIARIEAEDPDLAAALHRWLAGTLADRLDDTIHTFDALLD